MPDQNNRLAERKRVEDFTSARRKKEKAKAVQAKVVAGRKALREYNTPAAKAKRRRDALTKKGPSGFTRLLSALSGKKT